MEKKYTELACFQLNKNARFGYLRNTQILVVALFDKLTSNMER